MRRKTFIAVFLLAACAALVCLAGCGSPSSSVNLPPPGAGAPPDVLAPAGSAAPPSSVPSPSAAPRPGSTPADSSQSVPAESNSAAEVKSFTGVIESIGMGKYYVQLENMQVIAFPYDGADMSGLVGDRPGSPVVVYYTGTLSGTDTSAMTVIKMATPE